MKKLYQSKYAVLVIWLLTLSITGYAQSRVTGKVTGSDDNEPIPGATVLVKGTTNGVITDMDGMYSIELKNGDVIVFSFVGYQKREISYRGESVMDALLEVDITSLNEVVIMGYSEKMQKELSASVVSLSAKQLQNVTSPNIQTMLQGKVPGLIVSSPSGQPGQAADLRIRGITSLNIDHPPLMVVDGMIGGNFVPNDVETVTILKDAAAIGLYGAAGAAGVIVVTTKQASPGTFSATASSKVGWKEAVTGNFKMMNSEQLYDAQQQMWGSQNQVSFLTNRPEALMDKDFNWMDAGFQRAMLQNHNLSLRGAGKDVTYGFSADYYKEDGTFINTDFERLNLRGTLKFSPSKRFTFQTDINAQSTQDHINHYSSFEDVFWNTPWDSPTHMENGVDVTSSPSYVTNPANKWIGQFKRNFINSSKYNELGSRGQDLVWSARTAFHLTDWLSLETRTRLNSYSSTYKEYFSPKTDQGIAFNGIINETKNEGMSILSTHFLRFSKKIGNHDIGGFIAQEGGYNISRSSIINGMNLSTPSIKVLDGASVITNADGADVEGRGISFISELSYGFRSKYFATAYWRADGSSVFAENKRFGYFPGGSIAWLLSEESALSGISAISLLKLRASYGLTGNNGIPPYKSLPTYNISRQYNSQPGAEPNNPANPNLAWETTKMWNAGVDFELLNALTINIDLYEKKVEGMLLNNPLAFSTGYEKRTENIGDMRNRGIELNFTFNKSFGDFSYNANFNVAYNHNEITKVTDILDSQPVTAGAIQQVNQVGLSAFTWYMPKWMGVNPDDGSPQWEVIDYDLNGKETGRSLTGDYAIAADNFQPIKSALPKYTGGFSNSLSYKGLTLSFLFTFQTGNYIYNYTREFVDSDGANTGINLMQLKDGWSRWEKPGDIATHPVLKRGGSNGAHNTSSRYLEKGDFIRLRNVNLSYSLPQSILKMVNIKQATLSLSADNLITFTDFSGMDPDIGLQVQEYSLPGLSYLKYPISKQFLIGLTINF